MTKICTLIFILLSMPGITLFAQQEDYQVGVNPNSLRQSQGAFYDYSDPNTINIKVAVWGYVKFPGRYILPAKSDVKDLISYAGGVNDDAYLDELRIYRINSDSTQSLLELNYNDLWWGESLNKNLNLQRLQAGDVLIVPGRNRLYWENYLGIILSTLGFFISLATLIITASK